MFYWSETKKWKIPTMPIASNISLGITLKKYPSSDQHQAPEHPAARFHGHPIQISNPAGHQVTTSGTVSDSIQTSRNWHVDRLGKYTDLLVRFVNGDIYRSDYQQLYALGLLSFRDILNLSSLPRLIRCQTTFCHKFLVARPAISNNFKVIPHRS